MQIDGNIRSTSKTGYHFSEKSGIWTMIELMNQTPNPVDGYLTVEYEYVEAPFPPDFQNLTSVWLDVSGCKNSELETKTNTTFELDSPEPWTVPAEFDGRAVIMGGHLHDGGTRLEIMHNEKVVCESKATYGGTPSYIDPVGLKMDGMSDMGDMRMTHISDMSTCGLPVVKAGDEFTIRAHYNLTAHPGMREANGEQARVMGIGLMYFAAGDGEAQKATAQAEATAPEEGEEEEATSATPTQAFSSATESVGAASPSSSVFEGRAGAMIQPSILSYVSVASALCLMFGVALTIV